MSHLEKKVKLSLVLKNVLVSFGKNVCLLVTYFSLLQLVSVGIRWAAASGTSRSENMHMSIK